MRIALGFCAAALLAVAACGSSQSSSPATVTVTSNSTQPTVAKRSGTQEYQSVRELAEDLVKHGYTCDLQEMGGGRFSLDGGQCAVGGENMILGIYASQSQIDAQVRMANGVMESLGLDYGWLTGKNWAINCSGRVWCEYVAAGLGGSIIAPFTPGNRLSNGPQSPPPAPTPR
ncbi:hypothetical protein [Mycobacterium gordonae]|uniref:hypothetical protein n=1 Tax=Mycobacterium gordonae TaxID=1778 RepID=UPI000B079756|nr:hypothetical protein [Mycobacterium gordonae]